MKPDTTANIWPLSFVRISLSHFCFLKTKQNILTNDLWINKLLDPGSVIHHITFKSCFHEKINDIFFFKCHSQKILTPNNKKCELSSQENTVWPGGVQKFGSPRSRFVARETASKQHHSLLHQSGFIILVRESSFQLLRTQCDDKPRIFSNARGLVSKLFSLQQMRAQLGWEPQDLRQNLMIFLKSRLWGVVLLGIYVSKNGRFWF